MVLGVQSWGHSVLMCEWDFRSSLSKVRISTSESMSEPLWTEKNISANLPLWRPHQVLTVLLGLEELESQ